MVIRPSCHTSFITNIKHGGAEGSRTPDLLIANETLYQLSYDPSEQVHFNWNCVMRKHKRGEIDLPENPESEVVTRFRLLSSRFVISGIY